MTKILLFPDDFKKETVEGVLYSVTRYSCGKISLATHPSGRPTHVPEVSILHGLLDLEPHQYEVLDFRAYPNYPKEIDWMDFTRTVMTEEEINIYLINNPIT